MEESACGNREYMIPGYNTKLMENRTNMPNLHERG